MNSFLGAAKVRSASAFHFPCVIAVDPGMSLYASVSASTTIDKCIKH